MEHFTVPSIFWTDASLQVEGNDLAVLIYSSSVDWLLVEEIDVEAGNLIGPYRMLQNSLDIMILIREAKNQVLKSVHSRVQEWMLLACRCKNKQEASLIKIVTWSKDRHFILSNGK